MVRIAITQHPDDPGRAVADALSMLDLEGLRDRQVAVKVNETWASPDDTTGVTQPDTLRAVLRALKDAGAGELLVTGGAGAAETEDVFRYAGLLQVLQEEEVPLFDHNRPPFTEVTLDYGDDGEVCGPQQTVIVNPRVLEYERLVVVSQIKMHATATVTLALKNIAMSFPAADHYGHPRGTERHEHGFFDDMHSFIAAMGRRFPIDLAVTVGHPAMVATGPLAGYAVETGLAVASADALAADAAAARILGFHLQGVRHLWEAARLGVGDADLEAAEFPGLDLREAIGRFTEKVYGRRLTFEHP
jgi:uncharacterized protein (DUF362 family)